VPTHRAEALDDDGGVAELQHLSLAQHVCVDRQPEPGRAELVERDSAEHGRQADGPPDLIVDVRHRRLAGAHVRTRV
jgi:hypothetical protein